MVSVLLAAGGGAPGEQEQGLGVVDVGVVAGEQRVDDLREVGVVAAVGQERFECALDCRLVDRRALGDGLPDVERDVLGALGVAVCEREEMIDRFVRGGLSACGESKRSR